ncbi:MAG: ATP-binding cassette domain-containing protein [Phycisphaerales bacterium]|nr:ATP-binding cassette domain-containing protein [Phycisphaerales bacterium]
MNNIVIQLTNVNKSFGALQAVRNVSFEIQRGQVCGFLGPNGAGKSTTIRMIMSILLPDSGAISVLGGSALDAKDRIGYLPEERGLYRKMRVADFLRFIAKLKGISRNDADTRIRSWLERVELPGVSQKRCEELSKGMQQKLQFIASVLHEPLLLILDEPFSGLDPVNRRLLSSIVRQLKESGTTILFSTHQMEQAEDLCDQVLLIHKGEKVLDETMGEIRGRFDPRTILAEPANSIEVSTQALQNVSDIETFRWSMEHKAFEIRVAQGVDTQLAMASVMRATPLRRVELQRATLDDVFVKLVGGTVAEIETAEKSGKLQANHG